MPKKKGDHGTEVANGGRASTDCGPPSVEVKRWGAWNVNDGAALDSAYANARSGAARACRGNRNCQRNQSCVYTELEAEILDEETRQNDRGETEFRFQARSKGACACE